MAELIGESAPL